ncbi:molybdopterin-containing oxidoreductase family protein [Thiothrix subterranea]|uniref:Molybdopterin-dependent oxidoreductase n=1 Tax=Thiothrix subterranea TaxID=2735563 RepID=A0AA51MPF2_9GAMM|nr:molybdopterin-dependent oxidoreductase [Thiothrix subterranea]MDQ5767046.1 molybdopterin-dependent oxidoreductase [Thiothrix subterranea]WML88092.1 molybdopterin-dependent oxidoreductase [Thiothrix subterranea]
MTAPAHTDTVVKSTTCYECDANCLFDVTIDASGRAIKVEGLPNCPRGQLQLERQYHPDRLLYPLKRVGAKGSGEFERISWEEALDTITAALQKTKAQYGAPAVGFFAGYTKEARPQLQRLAHAFGSPNYLTESGCCFSATMVAEKLTYGYKLKTTSTVESPKTQCVLVWSTNASGSIPPFENHHLANRKKGRKMIVVDPRRTETAELADIHLQIRPGTDGALALGFHHLIFANGWQDQAFLDEWANGLDAFRDYIQEFPPQRVAAICGISEADLRAAVELFATTSPAQIAMSPTSTVQHSNGFQNHRAMILLSAVTGNIDREGGNRFFNDKVLPKPIELFDVCKNELPPRIGDEVFPIWTKYWPAAQSMLMPDCILEGKPQPLKALLAMGINTAMWANSKRMERALGELEFFAVSDFFHNPATLQADIVLPAATSLERTALIAYPGCAYQGEVKYRHQALSPRGEAKPDGQIFLELGVKLGMAAQFWHGNLAASWEEMGEGLPPDVRKEAWENPAGVTVYSPVIEELVELGFLDADRQWRINGFRTATGKIEFDSVELQAHGYDGLPTYREPMESPLSTPELLADYPLVLTSGGRQKFFTHSQQHNIPAMLAYDPYPRVQIHPDDAAARGIVEGDSVEIRSRRGAVTFRAAVTDIMKPGVVHCFHGWNEANINELTDDTQLDPISGFPPFKSLLCEVSRL